jgi:3-isopropylmalate dehydrogenase
MPPHLKPETGLLELRRELEAYSNLRPVKAYEALLDSSPLRPELVRGLDLVLVRELTGGIYFGQPRGDGLNTMCYSPQEVRRVARVAAELARARKGCLCSVDKANVLEVSQLWRREVNALVEEAYPDLELTHMYVDNAAMQLVRSPGRFDVLVTGNLFGDILSDLASVLPGSIGLAPSACIGDGSKPGLFEPVHGSAPDIAGTNRANPLAMFLSLAMLLEQGLHMRSAAATIRGAVDKFLEMGYRTADLARPGDEILSTDRTGELVRGFLERS